MKHTRISGIHTNSAALERVMRGAAINHEVVDEKQRQMIAAAR